MSCLQSKTVQCCTEADFDEKVTAVMQCLVPDQFSLVSLDFDNFNYINDLFGYDTGSFVLQRMEQHFSQKLNKDECFVRPHADHFVFLVYSGPQPVEERFLQMTDLRCCMEGILPQHYSLVCSGGIIPITKQVESVTALTDKANFARKQAKGYHLSRFLYYDDKLRQELEWKKLITIAMEEALKNREFEMYLQPKVEIQSGQLAGAEALVRWRSPRFGLIAPDHFIPVLEQNGFITLLDFDMLKQACAFLREATEMKMPPLPVSVNFSKLHIRYNDFPERVSAMTARYGIPNELIEIEFTESVCSDDFEALQNIAGRLRALGFSVSLDDFGKAYSSLNCLKDLPFDIIKIDKGFLNCTSDLEKGRMIVAKVIDMIKALEMTPVMEGVETQEQVIFLKQQGCDIGQGYFYSRPMPANQYMNLLSIARTTQ